MSLVERDRAAAYFADGEEGAQMLVCSEIGSEGRNFQFAHHLVLFDLPQNPDLLEQRIGRLDRIGQQHTVQLHVPYFTGTAQEVMLQWYHRGINAFEQTCPAGGLLRAQFSQRLEAALAQPDDRETQDTLIVETAEYYAQTLAELEAGRDKLLELNSCNQDEAQAIIERIKAAEDAEGLTTYMQLSFDQFGVDHHHHSESAWVLEPTENMHEPFPELPEDGLSVCFDRQKALAREELAFLTWEHPMVTGTMDRVLSGDHGNSSVCSIKLPPLKAGSWLLEAIYVLHCPAPKAHQLNRVLPTTPIRLLLETTGKDLAHALPGSKLTQLAQKIPTKTAADIVKAIKSELEPRVAKAKALAQSQADLLIDSAKADLQQDLQAELDRMKALATVNPSIRPEEIAYLETQLIDGLGYIDQTQVRLDAVRIIVVNN
jgi:ATP-dependent helicase HepA